MYQKGLFPPTSLRVNLHTNKQTNAKIQDRTEADVILYGEKHKDEISKRINELQCEWDTERTLETNASILILISLLLGFLINQIWFILAGIVAAFLLQHALQGWCPPLPIIRRLGVRTAREIDDEIIALRMLRGDFTESKDAQEVLNQIRGTIQNKNTI